MEGISGGDAARAQSRDWESHEGKRQDFGRKSTSLGTVISGMQTNILLLSLVIPGEWEEPDAEVN